GAEPLGYHAGAARVPFRLVPDGWWPVSDRLLRSASLVFRGECFFQYLCRNGTALGDNSWQTQKRTPVKSARPCSRLPPHCSSIWVRCQRWSRRSHTIRPSCWSPESFPSSPGSLSCACTITGPQTGRFLSLSSAGFY